MSVRLPAGEALHRFLTEGWYGFRAELPFGGLAGDRGWRWDYAIEGLRLAVEYMGKGPGHQWNAGLDRDYQKITEGQLCGWTVVICNSESVNDGRCLGYVEAALAHHSNSNAINGQEDS